MTNPLLHYHAFPPFKEIKIEHIEPALDHVLSNNEKHIEKLLEQNEPPSWHHLMAPLEAMQDQLDRLWSPISHMHNVVDSEELRKVYNKCLPKISAYYTKMGHNKKLFQAIKLLADSPEFKTLSQAQKKIIENDLRDFHLSGVDLNPADKKQFAKLQENLSKLHTKFSENVLDATQAFTLHIKSEDELSGIPSHAMASAKSRAHDKKLDGWLFTLEQPDYLAIMQYADNRTIRRTIYEAYVTRASDTGPNPKKWDNTQVMFDILKTLQNMASLLGFNNAAELSLARKMAKNTQEVLDFIHNLAKKARSFAEKEFNELHQFSKETDNLETLNAWDLAYYSEKLRHKKFSITQEELRPYFPIDKVLSGMFQVVSTLYDITFEEIFDFQSWHKDVRLFKIIDDTKATRAYFYLDLYARPQKRDGAWMDECRIKRTTEHNAQQLPIAYLTCNFAKAIEGKPALLTHNDVLTLFHEFGHGLHHMLTTINYAGVSGINGVEWDAVELPSQFLENWCWQSDVLKWISSHVDTGKPLPDSMLEKLHEAKNFQSGLQMLRQLEFALFDFKLHMEFDPEKTPAQIQEILDAVRKEISVVPVPAFNRFQHGFSHIFAGGYSAGYYSYKWAEVLSSDAFSAFEETGIFNKTTGKRFLHTILEKGGSETMEKMFMDFRGRAPKIDALLEHTGLVEK